LKPELEVEQEEALRRKRGPSEAKVKRIFERFERLRPPYPRPPRMRLETWAKAHHRWVRSLFDALRRHGFEVLWFDDEFENPYREFVVYHRDSNQVYNVFIDREGRVRVKRFTGRSRWVADRILKAKKGLIEVPYSAWPSFTVTRELRFGKAREHFLGASASA